MGLLLRGPEQLRLGRRDRRAIAGEAGLQVPAEASWEGLVGAGWIGGVVVGVEAEQLVVDEGLQALLELVLDPVVGEVCAPDSGPWR